MEASGIVIHHPNREKAESKATKAGVILLLLVSAALIGLILIGGWSRMAGAVLVAIAYILIYAAMAYFVARWSRGVLPLAAGLAIIFTSMAVVAAPAWFARNKDGLSDPLLPAEFLGLLTLVLIAVQLLLILFSMRAFAQAWNVEVEVSQGEAGYPHGGAGGEDEPRREESPRDEQPGSAGAEAPRAAQPPR